MVYSPEDEVIKGVQWLYSNSPHAKQLFDLNAQRERDARSTSIDVFERKLDISRSDARALARELEEAGCGVFKSGRRGWSSRLEWKYSCIVLGKVAAGQQIALKGPENTQDEEELEAAEDIEVMGLTIAEAKAGLATGLGIAVEQIEIHIKV
jgi:biotin operon repressor